MGHDFSLALNASLVIEIANGLCEGRSTQKARNKGRRGWSRREHFREAAITKGRSQRLSFHVGYDSFTGKRPSKRGWLARAPFSSNSTTRKPIRYIVAVVRGAEWNDKDAGTQSTSDVYGQGHCASRWPLRKRNETKDSERDNVSIINWKSRINRTGIRLQNIEK